MKKLLKAHLVKVLGEEEDIENNLNLLRAYLNGHKQNVGRNMDGKSQFDEVSDGNEFHIFWHHIPQPPGTAPVGPRMYSKAQAMAIST